MHSENNDIVRVYNLLEGSGEVRVELVCERAVLDRQFRAERVEFECAIETTQCRVRLLQHRLRVVFQLVLKSENSPLTCTCKTRKVIICRANK